MSRLADRWIVLTRDAEDNAAWAREIEARGARALSLPCIRCEARDDRAARDELDAALRGARWLLFGSRRGVAASCALLDPKRLRDVPIGAVGPKTADACRRHIGRVDLVASEGTARSLAADLLASGDVDAGARVVFAGAERTGGDLAAGLAERGVTLSHVVVYRTLSAEPAGERDDLARLGAPVVLLASPSAVEGLLARARVPPEALLITIGPATSTAVRRAGLRVAGEAKARDLEGLLEAIP